MDAIYAYLSSHILWCEYQTVEVPSLDVIEVTLQQSSDPAHVTTRKLSVEESKSWLGEAPGSILLRLVLVRPDHENHRLYISRSILSEVLHSFGLVGGFEYFRSCFAGIATLPVSRPGDDSAQTRSSHSFTYAPKIAALWSNSRADDLDDPAKQAARNDVVLFAELGIIKEIKALLGGPWTPNAITDPGFPALLLALVLSKQVDETQDDIKTDLRKVEVRTGHHGFANRRELAAEEDLGLLSSKMSGFSAKLASVTRKTTVVQDVLAFMDRQQPVSNSDASPPLRDCVEFVRNRLRMQETDTSYIQERVRIQIAALSHIITQTDTLVGISLAQSSQTAAIASQSDSLSMKTVAIAAMVFLPGSFVASIFSTEILDWDSAKDSSSIGIGLNPQFKLYWAITLPLTVATLLANVGWLYYQRRRHRIPPNSEQYSPVLGFRGAAESGVLSMRRKTVLTR